jgi:putative ABC transport system ATP-binding protein
LQLPFSLKANRGRRFDRERILALLAVLGRGPSFLEQSSRDLSRGEGQIVALLRALQLDPSVLLLDEPTASLDEGTARGIEKLIACWQSDEPTARALVWVSHDEGQSRRVANRRLFMRGGHLEPDL